MCGKVQEMWEHLAGKCANISNEVRSLAVAELGRRILASNAARPPGPKDNRRRRQPPSRNASNASLATASSPVAPASSPVAPALIASPQPLTPEQRAALVMRNINPDNPTQPLASFVGAGSSSGTQDIEWTPQLRMEFTNDFCMLMLAANMAWWSAENPFVRHFFSKWIRGAVVPSRKQLSGPILNQQAARVEAGIKTRMDGHKFGTGQCDGWKNVAKSSIIGVVVNAESEVSVFGTCAHDRDQC